MLGDAIIGSLEIQDKVIFCPLSQGRLPVGKLIRLKSARYCRRRKPLFGATFCRPFENGAGLKTNPGGAFMSLADGGSSQISYKDVFRASMNGLGSAP